LHGWHAHALIAVLALMAVGVGRAVAPDAVGDRGGRSVGTPTGHDETTAGVLAAQAEADILLFTDSAPGELAALERSFARGAISRAAANASYQRIVALKRKVAG
jgi:hypothetical protein